MAHPWRREDKVPQKRGEAKAYSPPAKMVSGRVVREVNLILAGAQDPRAATVGVIDKGRIARRVEAELASRGWDAELVQQRALYKVCLEVTRAWVQNLD